MNEITKVNKDNLFAAHKREVKLIAEIKELKKENSLLRVGLTYAAADESQRTGKIETKFDKYLER